MRGGSFGKLGKIWNILKGPFSVALMIVTLGAAFGVLSGRGAYLGMLSTSVIAFVMAMFGGTKFGVSSPTGPMTAAVAVLLLTDADWLLTHSSQLSAVDLMSITLVFAAIFLLVMTAVGVHKLIHHVPNLVVAGFVNGIALLIVFAQVRAMDSSLDFVLMICSFLVAFFAPFRTALFAIVTVSILALISGLPFTQLDLTSADLGLNLAWPRIFEVDWEIAKFVLPLAFELALLVLLDTLLTAVIMDSRTRTKSNFVKELLGQGASLFAVSTFGGIPGAQSTVPSVMMEQEKVEGTRGKLLMALFAILITLGFTPLLAFVPEAVFAGVILKIAYDVADFTSLKSTFGKNCWRKGVQFLILVGTMLSTVLISLNLAVVLFTFLFVVWNNIMPKGFRVKDLMTIEESEGLIDEV